MSVKIVYSDIAVGAAEDAAVSATGSVHSTLSVLPFGTGEDKRFATFERNWWLLDGTRKAYDNDVVSFWTSDISGDDCEFTTPATITITFDNRYTSLGVTLRFVGVPASEVNVKWYQGNTVLHSETYYPDQTEYFCAATVEAYDKITVTITKSWMPFSRVQIDKITFGIIRTFTRGDLRSGKVNITQEIDVTSRELAANALDWTLSSHEDVEYLFQLKQPVEAYDDDTLMGCFYIQDSDRLSGNVYDITCTDAIGVLEDEMFPDAVYTNKNAYALAQEICAPFSVDMDASLQSKTVSGILKGQTKRGALQQLCFAIKAVADTSASDDIKIFQLPTTIKEIPESRIRIGGSVTTDAIVTEVRLMSHSYSTSGSTNMVEINGVKYYDTQNVTVISNPNVTASDKQNVVDIQDATLISPANVSEIAQNLYDMCQLRKTHNVSFRVSDEMVGDKVQTVTPWNDTITGFYKKGSIVISGITVSAAEVIGS